MKSLPILINSSSIEKLFQLAQKYVCKNHEKKLSPISVTVGYRKGKQKNQTFTKSEC